MPIWGRNAFAITNGTPAGHRFNFDVVGDGKAYRNLFDEGRRINDLMEARKGMIVDLILGSYFENDRRLLKTWKSFKCKIDTGATISILTAHVAKELGLTPTNPTTAAVTLANGKSMVALWSEQLLHIPFGPRPADGFSVVAWFAVSRKRLLDGSFQDAWESGIPSSNLIGMKDVLRRWMLCFTPETLFVFGRAQPAVNQRDAA